MTDQNVVRLAESLARLCAILAERNELPPLLLEHLELTLDRIQDRVHVQQQ